MHVRRVLGPGFTWSLEIRSRALLKAGRLGLQMEHNIRRVRGGSFPSVNFNSFSLFFQLALSFKYKELSRFFGL